MPNGVTGAALLLGFLAMLLLEQYSGGHAHSHKPHHPHTSSSDEDAEDPSSTRPAGEERHLRQGLLQTQVCLRSGAGRPRAIAFTVSFLHTATDRGLRSSIFCSVSEACLKVGE